jgi:hypothetical protein
VVRAGSRPQRFSLTANDEVPAGLVVHFGGIEVPEGYDWDSGPMLGADGITGIPSTPATDAALAGNAVVSADYDLAPGTYVVTAYLWGYRPDQAVVSAYQTVTVVVLPRLATTLHLRPAHRRGFVRLSNDNPFAVRVDWGAHWPTEQQDGHVVLAPGEERRVRVHRRSLVWVATAGREFDFDLLRHVRLPAGQPHWAPGVTEKMRRGDAWDPPWARKRVAAIGCAPHQVGAGSLDCFPVIA